MADALIYALGIVFAAPILTLAIGAWLPYWRFTIYDLLFLVLPIAAGLVMAFAPAGAHLRKAAVALALPLLYLWLRRIHSEQMALDCVACLLR